MNLIEGLVEALKAEHAHIERVVGDFNSAFDARQRANRLVNRLIELNETSTTEEG